MEVYGTTDIELQKVTENDLGYIDILTPRSSYSEGKRICECLCYSITYGLHRCYGNCRSDSGWDHGRLFHPCGKGGSGLHNRSGHDIFTGEGERIFGDTGFCI